MLPRTHPWSQRHKGLIIASLIVLIALASVVVGVYERYYRGPGESILFGTWKATSDDRTMEFRFNSDHSFVLFFDESQWQQGRWHAGGKNIYCRWDDPNFTQLVIWRIGEVSPDALQVKFYRDGKLFTFKRES